MTEDELDAIEARANAAQPGPWPLPGERMSPGGSGGPNYDERLPLDHEGCDVWPWHTDENMAFAYRARDDVPALVAEVRRLRDAISANTSHDRDEYDGRCLPHCWRCDLDPA